MTHKSIHFSRRSFFKAVAAGAAASGMPLWFFEREMSAAPPRPVLSPNDRPGIALVGCGGMGRGDAENAKRFGDIVAVCDVDSRHVTLAVKRLADDGKRPDACEDFRKIMERKDVHAVICGTPDHWHTLVSMAAVRAGKDVYCEKPLTLTIDEGKRLVKVVRKHKAVLQTGSQQRSDAKFRLACELVRNGRLGKLKEVNVWLPAGLREGPFQTAPRPTELNWDFWQGPAPATDYVPQRAHTFFRYWYDYSGGTMTDWGAHHNDIASWAIGLPGPSGIEGKALSQPIPGGYTAIADYEVKFTYPTGVILNVRSTKADNIFGAVEEPEGQRNGLQFVGADGWIWVNRGNLRASDKALIDTPLPDSAVRLYKSDDHMGNFFDCMRSRKAPVADVEVGHRAATICHLSAIALRTGLQLKWDAKKETFTGEGAKEANKYLAREMRKPYDYGFAG